MMGKKKSACFLFYVLCFDTHTHTHSHIPTYTHTHIHTHIRTHIRTHIDICISVTVWVVDSFFTVPYFQRFSSTSIKLPGSNHGGLESFAGPACHQTCFYLQWNIPGWVRSIQLLILSFLGDLLYLDVRVNSVNIFLFFFFDLQSIFFSFVIFLGSCTPRIWLWRTHIWSSWGNCALEEMRQSFSRDDLCAPSPKLQQRRNTPP